MDLPANWRCKYDISAFIPSGECWCLSYKQNPKSARVRLHALDGEGQCVEQDCEIHEEPPVPDVIEVVLWILMN